jgi:hypothetical protein
MAIEALKKNWLFSIIVVATTVGLMTLMNKSSNKSKEVENTNEVLQAFYNQEEAKPCINPPLQDVNIPYAIYNVNAEKGGTIDFKTGSTIVIPKNAFVDDNGKLLKGDIELRYREFHDVIDFFVAGIPMTYDSAGVRYHFESAGMMEMLAFQNGKEVNMAKDKSINVELASNQKGAEYNLYKLDTLKNNWSCLGKDRVVENNPTSSGKGREQAILASIPEIKEIKIQKEESKKEKETKIASLAKPKEKPSEPLKLSKERYAFNIDVDPKEFPELAVFKNVVFEVSPENTNFNREMYNITWDEVTVKEGTKKGQNYWLNLKKGSQKQDLLVYPVLEGKNYEKAQAEYQGKLDKYTLALEKRKFDEKLIELDYKQKLESLKKQQKQVELKWKANMEREFAATETEQKVKRMFAINSFGVYNCDNPLAFPTGVTTKANLLNEKNEKVMCYEVYLVDRAKNALFTYTKNPIVKFSFNDQTKNVLWTVDNGVLYWLKPEQFADIKGSEEVCNLKMNRVDQKFKSVEEIKAFFNF